MEPLRDVCPCEHCTKRRAESMNYAMDRRIALRLWRYKVAVVVLTFWFLVTWSVVLTKLLIMLLGGEK